MAKFKKGQSGNPNGRPKGTKTVDIPDECKDVMRELAIGYAMDPKHPKHHEYLMKFMDKMFASLKATDPITSDITSFISSFLNLISILEG